MDTEGHIISHDVDGSITITREHMDNSHSLVICKKNNLPQETCGNSKYLALSDDAQKVHVNHIPNLNSVSVLCSNVITFDQGNNFSTITYQDSRVSNIVLDTLPTNELVLVRCTGILPKTGDNPKLTRLVVRDCKAHNFVNSCSMTNLTFLDVGPCALVDENIKHAFSDSVFDRDPYVNKVIIESASRFFSTYFFLGQLVNLETLILRGTKLKDLSFMKKMINLKVVDISHSNVKDLKYLKGLNLEELYMDRVMTRDFSTIQGMTNLRVLSMKGCLVIKLDFLDALSNLEIISLDNTCITMQETQRVRYE